MILLLLELGLLPLTQFDTGACLATELKNNAFKLGRWTAQAPQTWSNEMSIVELGSPSLASIEQPRRGIIVRQKRIWRLLAYKAYGIYIYSICSIIYIYIHIL